MILERHIPFEGNRNFRDLGGYQTSEGRQVHWRRLFRSDCLHELSAADITKLREMQVQTVFDLRSTHELEIDGLGEIYQHGIIHRHTPLIPENAPRISEDDQGQELDYADSFLKLIGMAEPVIAEIFTDLAEASTYPAVFHCSSGKDRSGVLSALILRTLGVDDETIIEDYALSTQYITPYLEEQLAAGAFEAFHDNVTPEMLRANPANMRKLLANIDASYGPGAEVVRACGVSMDSIGMLRDLLLLE